MEEVPLELGFGGCIGVQRAVMRGGAKLEVRSEQIGCEGRRPMGGQERTGQEELWSREVAAGQEGD